MNVSEVSQITLLSGALNAAKFLLWRGTARLPSANVPPFCDHSNSLGGGWRAAKAGRLRKGVIFCAVVRTSGYKCIIRREVFASAFSAAQEAHFHSCCSFRNRSNGDMEATLLQYNCSKLGVKIAKI